MLISMYTWERGEMHTGTTVFVIKEYFVIRELEGGFLERLRAMLVT